MGNIKSWLVIAGLLGWGYWHLEHTLGRPEDFATLQQEVEGYWAGDAEHCAFKGRINLQKMFNPLFNVTVNSAVVPNPLCASGRASLDEVTVNISQPHDDTPEQMAVPLGQANNTYFWISMPKAKDQL